MSGYFSYCIPPLAGHDLAILERTLVRFCVKHDVPLTSFEASDAATALVELFRRGCESEKQLGKILGLRASNSNRPTEHEPMLHHRIPVGSLVRFTHQSKNGDMYRVLAWMPEAEGSPRYRIRNKTWSCVAEERDLRIVAPQGARQHLSMRSQRVQAAEDVVAIEAVFPRYKAVPQ